MQHIVARFTEAKFYISFDYWKAIIKGFNQGFQSARTSVYLHSQCPEEKMRHTEIKAIQWVNGNGPKKSQLYAINPKLSAL